MPLLMDPGTNWKDEILLERHGTGDRRFYGLRVPGWKYIEYGNGDRELYDLTTDPYELENNANLPAYQTKQDELAQRLRANLGPNVYLPLVGK